MGLERVKVLVALVITQAKPQRRSGINVLEVFSSRDHLDLVDFSSHNSQLVGIREQKVAQIMVLPAFS